MGFFDWFKRTPSEPEVEEMRVNPLDLMRRLLYDARLEPVDASLAAFGVIPQSEEVARMSLSASDSRLEALDPIFPMVALLVGLLEDGFLQGAMADHHGVSPQVVERLKEMHEHQTLAAVTAVLANLVDMGFIELGDMHVIGMHPMDNGKEQP